MIKLYSYECKNTLAIYVLLLLYKNVESKQPHKISTLTKHAFYYQERFL